MKRFIAALITGISFYAGSASADVTCTIPDPQNGYYAVLCSDDGKGGAGYACTVSVSIDTTNPADATTILFNGSVAQNQQGVVIWSANQLEGWPITSATLKNTDCDDQSL